MKDINRIGKLRDVKYSPFPQDMYADLSCALADNIDRLPVRWLKPALKGKEFEASLSSRLRWKVSEVVET